MQYTVSYFIEKFKAIPENLWCTGYFGNYDNQHCANGHCGLRDNNCLSMTIESTALNKLFLDNGIKNERYEGSDWGAVAIVNDGHNKSYKQPTPKERILAALYDIKKLQYPELSNTTVEDLISEKVL